MRWTVSELAKYAKEDERGKAIVIESLTLLNDDTGSKKRSSVVQIVKEALHKIFDATPAIEARSKGIYYLIRWSNKDCLRPPERGEDVRCDGLSTRRRRK